jgi:hypothetical protein
MRSASSPETRICGSRRPRRSGARLHGTPSRRPVSRRRHGAAAAVAGASFQQSTAALLLSIFAAVALVLAAVGIFGVLSDIVSAPHPEDRVRMAVGAEPWHVRWLVVPQVWS